MKPIDLYRFSESLPSTSDKLNIQLSIWVDTGPTMSTQYPDPDLRFGILLAKVKVFEIVERMTAMCFMAGVDLNVEILTYHSKIFEVENFRADDLPELQELLDGSMFNLKPTADGDGSRPHPDLVDDLEVIYPDDASYYYGSLSEINPLIDSGWQRILYYISDGGGYPGSPFFTGYSITANTLDWLANATAFEASFGGKIYAISANYNSPVQLYTIDNTLDPEDGTSTYVARLDDNTEFEVELGILEGEYADALSIANDRVVARLTSAQESEIYNAELYVPESIYRTEIEAKESLERQELSVFFSLTNAFARNYVARPSDFNLILTLFERLPSATEQTWKGRLTSVKADSSKVELKFTSVLTSLRRPGLRLHYQKSCPHPIYGIGCLVKRANFAVPAEILEINGDSVTVFETFTDEYTEATADYFTGGLCELDGAFGYINKHTLLSGASLLKFSRHFQTLFVKWANEDFTPPLMVTLYPGCNRTAEMCLSRFDNIDNFGAFPFMPTSDNNPFQGDIF